FALDDDIAVLVARHLPTLHLGVLEEAVGGFLLLRLRGIGSGAVGRVICGLTAAGKKSGGAEQDQWCAHMSLLPASRQKPDVQSSGVGISRSADRFPLARTGQRRRRYGRSNGPCRLRRPQSGRAG